MRKNATENITIAANVTHPESRSYACADKPSSSLSCGRADAPARRSYDDPPGG
jgi:hypothetical protein